MYLSNINIVEGASIVGVSSFIILLLYTLIKRVTISVKLHIIIPLITAIVFYFLPGTISVSINSEYLAWSGPFILLFYLGGMIGSFFAFLLIKIKIKTLIVIVFFLTLIFPISFLPLPCSSALSRKIVQLSQQ